jgi:hypothetical protein
MKNLEIGKDYYSLFGKDESGKSKMVYNGGISWTAIQGERTMTMDSQKQTDSVLELINRASINIGRL